MRAGLILGLMCVVFSLFSPRTEAHLLRVGKLQIDPTQYWIVLGIQHRSQVFSAGFNFSSLGFQGKDMDHLDPKFLLKGDSDGIFEVRSFELNTLENDWINPDEEGDKRKCGNNHLLPPLLIQANRAKEAELKHLVASGCLKFGNLTGGITGLATAIGDNNRKTRENLKKTQAYYLLELIHKSLPENPTSKEVTFSEVREAFSTDPQKPELGDRFLRELGSALLTRFHPKSDWAGVHFQNKPGGDPYLEWRNHQLGRRSKNREYVQRRADELQLEMATIGRDLGILFIPSNIQDPGRKPPKKVRYYPEFIGLASENRSPDQVVESVRTELSRSSPSFVEDQPVLIPWTLISFVNAKGPVELLDFVFPVTCSENLYRLKRRNLNYEIGGSLIPLTYWFSKGIQKIAEYARYKKRNMKYLDRRESFGSVLALTETQFDLPILPNHLPLNQIFLTQFGNSLKALGLPHPSCWPSWSELAQLEGDELTKKTAAIIHDSTALLIAEMERRGRSSHAASFQEHQSSKAAYFLKLEKALKPSISFRENWGNSGSELEFETEERTSDNEVRSDGNERNSLEQSGRITGEGEIPTLADVADSPKPIILFLLDGLRPDRFKRAAQQGWMPHLRSLFFDRGTEYKSFVSRSLTLPSWATIFTGFEPDYHGIRSNTPTSRLKEEMIHNYEDPRPEIFDRRFRVKNRAFVHLEEDHVGEDGKLWLPGYYSPHQVVFNYMPISNNPLNDAGRLIKEIFHHRKDAINDTFFSASYLDSASAEAITEAIEKDVKKDRLRLVLIWFSGVDTASHHNNLLLPSTYQNIDAGVSKILNAAKEHPTLRDSTVFLLSDHGHSSGYDPFISDQQPSLLRASLSPFSDLNTSPAFSFLKIPTYQGSGLLSNTGFNLTRFLAGDYQSHPQYSFVVGTGHSTAPEFDWGIVSEFQLHPFRYVYPPHSGRPTALLDCAGDNMAQVYLDKNFWKKRRTVPWPRMNYYELSHFHGGRKGEILNIPHDLLSIRLPNLTVSDRDLAQSIVDLTQRYPVKLFAMALPGENARNFFDELLGHSESEKSNREPILVLANRPNSESPRFGVILSQSTASGEDGYKYLVLREFEQNKQGLISATVSLAPEDDPLDYLGTVISSVDSFSQWRSDEEWLSLAQGHPNPTAVFSLPRSLTLSARFSEKQKESPISPDIKALRQSETPDFILISNRGYAFHPESPLESDHGGLAYEEVRNTFIVSSLRPELFFPHRELTKPVLNRDVMPTVLDFAGIPIPPTQGKSRKSLAVTNSN